MGQSRRLLGHADANKLSDFEVPFTREFEPGRQVVGDDLKVELQIELKPVRPPLDGAIVGRLVAWPHG